MSNPPLTPEARAARLAEIRQIEVLSNSKNRVICLACGRRYGLHCDEDCDWPATGRKFVPSSTVQQSDVAWLLAELDALQAERDRLQQERDEARRFGEDAAAKYNALLEAYERVTCAFCGEEFPRGTPRHGDRHLAAHVAVCPEHPMRAVEAREQAREQGRRLLPCPVCEWPIQKQEGEICPCCGFEVGCDRQDVYVWDGQWWSRAHQPPKILQAAEAREQALREALTFTVKLITDMQDNDLLVVDDEDLPRLDAARAALGLTEGT